MFIFTFNICTSNMVSFFIKRVIYDSKSKSYLANDNFYALCFLLYLCLSWRFGTQVIFRMLPIKYIIIIFLTAAAKSTASSFLLIICFQFQMNIGGHFWINEKREAVDFPATIEEYRNSVFKQQPSDDGLSAEKSRKEKKKRKR